VPTPECEEFRFPSSQRPRRTVSESKSAKSAGKCNKKGQNMKNKDMNAEIEVKA